MADTVRIGDQYRNRCGTRTVTIIAVYQRAVLVTTDRKPKPFRMTIRHLLGGDYRKLA